MKSGISLARRFFACIAALYVLVYECVGSIANQELLVGVTTKPYVNSWYHSHLVQSYLSYVLLNASNMPSVSPKIIYLNGNATGELDVHQEGCTIQTSIDFLYKHNFLRQLVHVCLSDLNWNLEHATLVVDCSFDGRQLVQDTTMMKLYLVNQTHWSTFIVSTLSIVRPSKKLHGTAGVAMVSSTPWHALSRHADGTVDSDNEATYISTIGFSFPYEMNQFQSIELDSLVPPQLDGQWHARVVSTGESFHFAGTTGIFRSTPDVQASFNYFYWTLPSSPVEFAKTMEFVDVQVFKDIYGWFRSLLGLGIGVNIGINASVAIVVMTNLWLRHRVVWIPDVYPSIQSRAMLRAILLLFDNVVNRSWYLYQWAINQGNVRNQWGGAIDFDQISHSSCLMVCLGIVSLVAIQLKIRVDLSLVVFVYALCYHNRFDLVNQFGPFNESANEWIKKNYLENILPVSAFGMDLWAYHESSHTNYILIANELTWLLLALMIHLIYVALVKMYDLRHKRQRVNPTFMTHVSGSPKANQLHWARRSTLYNGLSSKDCENTKFERFVGVICSDVFGFVAPTQDYTMRHRRQVMTPSSIWLLGFVIIDNRFVIQIDDYFYLVLNVITQMPLFYVYGYPLEDDTLTSLLVRVTHEDISSTQVLHVSLAEIT